MNNTQQPLKPCPFCGMNPVIVTDRCFVFFGYREFIVECPRCLCSQRWTGKEEDAVANWNLRVSPLNIALTTEPQAEEKP